MKTEDNKSNNQKEAATSDNKQSSDVVMPKNPTSLGLSGKKNLTPLKNKKYIFALVIILVLVVGSAALFVVANNGQKQSTKNTKAVIPANIQEGKSSEIVFQEEYVNDTKGFLDQTKDPDVNKQYEAYVDLTYASYRVKKYDEALGYISKAEALKPTNVTADVYGMIYYEMKDYKNAVKYYDLASKRVPYEANPKINCLYNDYLALKKKAQDQL